MSKLVARDSARVRMRRTAHGRSVVASAPCPAVRCRVLVVDDDATFRELLTLLLSRHPEIEVIGTACDGVEAVESVERLQPDVVTMDIKMPRMNGTEATARIRTFDKPPRVVIVSSSLFRGGIAEARRSGAHAYVSKRHVVEDLASVVLAACRGEPFEEVW